MDPNAPAAPPPAAPPAALEPPVAPAAAARPEWLPEAHWDPTANTIKPEFGQHYSEVSTFYQTETEKRAALAARKPEDIKFEIKLPDTVKVPEGMQVKVDENDPRIPVIRDMALKNGWDQDTVNALVALDVQQDITAHNAEVERIKAEDAKLGANGPQRKDAVKNWAKGLLENKVITPEEHSELVLTATTGAGVTLLEKIMAKAGGVVPGHHDGVPPKVPTQSITDRWYGGGQQKA